MSSDELDFCKVKLRQAKLFKRERHDENINRLKEKKSRNKSPNQAMMASGITFMPLVQGNIQFGKLTKQKTPFAIEETHLQTNAVFSDEDKKVGMRKLVKHLKDIAFPPSENKLTNEEIEEQKFFIPLCSRASEKFTNTD